MDDYSWDNEFGDNEAKPSKREVKADVFGKFEADRKILNSEQKKKDEMGFRGSPSKQPSPRPQDHSQDNYEEDFEMEESRVKGEKESFQKNNSLNKQKRKLKQEELSNNHHREQTAPRRYQQEVAKKFETHQPEDLSSDAINRVNQQMRETIKKYNDLLSDLINKNLNQFMQAKNKKPQHVQDALRVIQEEIKNNEKIEQRMNAELYSLRETQRKLQERESDSNMQIEQEIQQVEKQIKLKKKELHEKQHRVDNEGKKLAEGKNIIHRDSGSAEVTITKENLAKIKKEHDRNEARLQELQEKEAELADKIEKIEGKDRQASEIKQATKVQEKKSKKYQQLRKKLQNSRNYCKKTSTLWNTKCSVIEHQNEAMRLKIRNIESQVKNLEDSVSSVYQKTQKTLVASKAKTETNQKILQRIVDDMKVYDSSENKNEFTASQMKLFPSRKPSTNNLGAAQHANEGPRKKTSERYRQEQMKNRVWKEPEVQKPVEAEENKRESREEPKEKQPKQKETEVNKVEDAESDQKQNKPKKFNFRKNRESSEVKLTQLHTQGEPSKPQEGAITTNKQPSYKAHPEPPKETATNQVDDQPIVAPPKRFNLRAKKNQEQSYIPSDEAANKPKPEVPTERVNDGIGGVGGDGGGNNKPMFNLKKRLRDSEAPVENEFI